ncbi:MAG: cyclic nucleotide-binding domain-containing protein [Rubrivivax sp.]
MGNDFFQYGPAAPSPSPVPAPAQAPAAAKPAAPREAAPADGGRAILGELSDEDWEKFIGFTARRRYPAGAVIFEIGRVAGALGFVASGAVEVAAEATPGAPARPDLREEGDVFGILGFLDGAAATMRVRARGSTEVLLLTREALLQLAAWQPRIAVALLRDLGAAVAARLRRVQGGD